MYKNEFYKKTKYCHDLGIKFWPWPQKLLPYRNPVVSMAKSRESIREPPDFEFVSLPSATPWSRAGHIRSLCQNFTPGKQPP